ncbi:fungal-specific transcription factor domain-containing protein [Penicillium angulare]|uniref:fungal-specific transcription factor domain-containing protein n=1 Tax=Penicillium angulare TaxID=116970 RepID=UPI002541429D|nr:fungal-specific transcription factor domain-containing protein [Penicillium angulare]KAJ5266473.1 fungal-specific transcription factor domain-containing protein [Penicillium angulare]
MAPQGKRAKIGSACQRCRRQKLKCDIKRPCTLCARAGVECQTADQWRAVQPPQNNEREISTPKRKPVFGVELSEDVSSSEQPWSSSTMSLVQGAFHLHDSTTPDTSLTTALPGGGILNGPTSPTPGSPLPATIASRPRWLRSTMEDLVSLFPSHQVAALLVDTYFDRVHWFMLIFHQDDFRQTWQRMYDYPRDQVVDHFPNPGFISTFLVVIAIALQYAGTHRKRLLKGHGISPVNLKEKILSTTRAKILDIVSLRSLESVQTCILLGTYYLYHGSPELAWPVCGCGLRVAQAMNLHRKVSSTTPMTPEMHRRNEARKRCWWAIYEIETFCSMSYGYPHNINDSDCDVELLDPLAKSATGQSSASFDDTHQFPASLLSYKYLMSKLSILVKGILTDLYRLGPLKGKRHSGSWRREIPGPLQLKDLDVSMTYSSADEMDQDIGASGPRFEAHIYQLQALALELAYENARILVHRPLLAYKSISFGMREAQDNHNQAQGPLSLALQSCRDAALKTSKVEKTKIFSLATYTYSATFIGIHTFTAGVMLCILISNEPLGLHSPESKIGLRRLLGMQSKLKSQSNSTLATQGLAILERLARLVMEKELEEILRGSQIVPTLADPGWESLAQNSDDRDQVHTSKEPTGEPTVIYIDDPVMSQALYEFDQELSRNYLNPPPEPQFPDISGSASGFAPEQGWIWGIDSLALFPEL